MTQPVFTQTMVNVPAFHLFDKVAQRYLRESSGGAGRVSNDRVWVWADDLASSTTYWTAEGAEWARKRAAGDVEVRRMSAWVEND